jgi:hypothetical protein
LVWGPECGVDTDAMAARAPMLLALLVAALGGRVFPGKDALVSATATVAVLAAGTLEAGDSGVHATADADAASTEGQPVQTQTVATWALVVHTLAREAGRRDVLYRRAAVQALTRVLRARAPADAFSTVVAPTVTLILGPAPSLRTAMAVDSIESRGNKKDEVDDDDNDNDVPHGRAARNALMAATLQLAAATLPSDPRDQGTRTHCTHTHTHMAVPLEPTEGGACPTLS